ncbi:enoyl-CoA hydratase/isomerase family protein [Alphaproteobacteria bacterium]|nr:enoyl-CoA hydratase/isomerase family protein [Alphaproteobacteria bacterium]
MRQSDIICALETSLGSRQVGVITFDRPKALNALSIEMVRVLHDQLNAWDQDESVSHVIIKSSSPRAFCAGGDVRYARELLQEDPVDGALDYFRAEYMADVAVAHFSKPIIALCDGIVMGGGAGIAQNCSHIIATDTTRFAMPETAIGLFPDATASLFLGRCPRPIALWLGLTGAIIDGADCMMLGLAHAVIKSTDVGALADALVACASSEIDDVVRRYQIDPGVPGLNAHRAAIDYIFGVEKAEDMVVRADDMARIKDDPYAAKMHTLLTTRCPTSIKVFIHLLGLSDTLDDEDAALDLDFKLALKMMRRPDLSEGIRAVLVDKDHAPEWSPSTLADVSDDMIADIFTHEGLPALR